MLLKIKFDYYRNTVKMALKHICFYSTLNVNFSFFWPGYFNPHGLMEFMEKESGLICSDRGSVCVHACVCTEPETLRNFLFL